MGQKNQKKISINNRTLLTIVILMLAVSYFTFWRIFLATNENAIPGIDVPSSFEEVSKTNADKTRSTPTDKGKSIILPILMYHHIGPLPANADSIRKDLTVSAENFELQTAWLKGQGYENVSLSNLLDYAKGQFKMPDKPVILTFDDGYADTFENAVPILKKYGFTGSFAIITQFPGIQVNDNSYAAWQAIRQAKAQGMEIIDHTQDHFDGTDPKYDDNFIKRNLDDSRKDLRDNLGQSLPILVYPFGRYNTKYLELAKQAGFEMGITIKESKRIYLNDLMEIPRIRVRGQESLDRFMELVTQ